MGHPRTQTHTTGIQTSCKQHTQRNTQTIYIKKRQLQSQPRTLTKMGRPLPHTSRDNIETDVLQYKTKSTSHETHIRLDGGNQAKPSNTPLPCPLCGLPDTQYHMFMECIHPNMRTTTAQILQDLRAQILLHEPKRYSIKRPQNRPKFQLEFHMDW
jgi:hypothetical protein